MHAGPETYLLFAAKMTDSLKGSLLWRQGLSARHRAYAVEVTSMELAPSASWEGELPVDNDGFARGIRQPFTFVMKPTVHESWMLFDRYKGEGRHTRNANIHAILYKVIISEAFSTGAINK